MRPARPYRFSSPRNTAAESALSRQAGPSATSSRLAIAMDHGWIVTFAAPDNPAAQISVMREDASAPVGPDASIEVDDVDAAHAAAERLGYEIVHPLTDEPWGVRRFFVREPTGKVLNILSHPGSPGGAG